MKTETKLTIEDLKRIDADLQDKYPKSKFTTELNVVIPFANDKSYPSIFSINEYLSSEIYIDKFTPKDLLLEVIERSEDKLVAEIEGNGDVTYWDNTDKKVINGIKADFTEEIA